MDKIELSGLRIAEFIALGSDMDAILLNYDIKALGLETSVVSFRSAFKLLADIYAREKGSILSKEIEMADFRRDQCIIAIKGIAENYLRHYDPAFVTAAEILLRTINKYGSSIATQNYMAESESLRQLCDDLEADGPAKDALVKLHLKEWAEEMRVANTAFSTLFQQRNKEASLLPMGNVKELRASAKIAYDGLMAMLNARNLVSPSAPLTALINELNILIGKYNRLLSTRQIIGGSDTPPPTPPPAN